MRSGEVNDMLSRTLCVIVLACCGCGEEATSSVGGSEGAPDESAADPTACVQHGSWEVRVLETPGNCPFGCDPDPPANCMACEGCRPTLGLEVTENGIWYLSFWGAQVRCNAEPGFRGDCTMRLACTFTRPNTFTFSAMSVRYDMEVAHSRALLLRYDATAEYYPEHPEPLAVCQFTGVAISSIFTPREAP